MKSRYLTGSNQLTKSISSNIQIKTRNFVKKFDTYNKENKKFVYFLTQKSDLNNYTSSYSRNTTKENKKYFAKGNLVFRQTNKRQKQKLPRLSQSRSNKIGSNLEKDCKKTFDSKHKNLYHKSSNVTRSNYLKNNLFRISRPSLKNLSRISSIKSIRP